MDYNDETKTLIIYNQYLPNISNEIEKIIFDYFSQFNKKIDNLQQNITHLTFIINFNKKVDNLPKNLTHLSLSDNFNQEVKKLPKNLTHLSFGVNFNQEIKKLPKNLKYFKIKWYFQNKILLPKNLKELSLTCNNNLINNILEHIEKIYVWFSVYNENTKVENLPLTIKEIVIENVKFKDYIKIPFGCVLTIKKFE
jgi:hypothetical protein